MNAGIGLVPVLTAGAAALIPFQGTGPQKFIEVHFQVGVAMHVLKNKIVLALLLGVFAFMAGCAGSSKDSGNANESDETAAVRDAKFKAQEADKLAMLESMYELFKSSVKNRAPSDVLLGFLTDSSEYWLDTLENHAKTYDATAMDTCQFYEAYAIVLYRLFEREQSFVHHARVLGEDGNAAFAFEVVGVHHAVHNFFTFVESSALFEKLVHQGCFTVVNVGDDGDVSDF